jgi:hypothetical protein
VHKYPNTTKLRSGILIENGVLRDRMARVVTRGKDAVIYQGSPDGALIAVQSADGPNPAISIPLFGGGRGYRGQHYHEVFSYPDFKRIGEAVPIPLKWSEGWIYIAWAPDSKSVIYRYADKPDAVIVPVPEPEAAGP